MKPYAVVSDQHHHNWSAFATVVPYRTESINSRLLTILDELERACKTLAEAGGTKLYGGGDLFHVRGAVAPSVLNPTKDRLEHCHKTYGTEFELNGGNHDMEGKNSSRIGNAVAALECDYIHVVSKPEQNGDMVIVPWFDNLTDLRQALAEIAARATGKAKTDLLIHAPMNDVIAGLPNKGLTAAELQKLGFRRVFVGHHHNHKDMGGGVYSIGATTHQTWGDVGSKAGFLIVTENEVKFHASHAPSFVDVNGIDDETELQLRCDGNYVRCKVTTSKISEIEALRKFLEKCGARGVVIHPVREPARVRAASGTVKAGASIETSVADFISATVTDHKEEVTRRSLQVLAEAA